MLPSHCRSPRAFPGLHMARFAGSGCALVLVAGQLLHAQAPTLGQSDLRPTRAMAGVSVAGSSLVEVSVGMDATAISSKIVSDLPNVGRQFTALVPAPYVRVDVDFDHRLELEVPFSVNIFHTSGLPTQKDVQIGALGNFYFLDNPTKVRPFLGAGGLYHWQSLGGSYSNSRTQFAVSAQLGLAVPITPNLDFRPLVLYQHWFAHSADSLPAENGFGGALGMTWRVNGGSTGFLPPNPCGTDFRIGFGLEHDSYGSYGGTSQPSETNFALPTPYLGLVLPVALHGQLGVGSNLSAQYTSFGGNHSYSIELQPRLEYNLLPTYRTKPSLRLGAEFNITRQKISTGYTYYGAGADAVVTVPFASRFTYFAGLGYDYQFKNTSAAIPAENMFTLKLGLDLRPWDKN